MIVAHRLCHLKSITCLVPPIPCRALFLALSPIVQEDERIKREREDQEKRRQKQHIDRLAKQVKVI